MRARAILVALAGGFAVAQAVSAQNPPHATANDAKASAELMGIERDIATANIKRDKAYFDRIEGDEFLFTGTTGALMTKKEDLAGLDEPQGEWVLDAFDPDDMKVYVYGNSAVVFGRSTTKVHNSKTEEKRTSESRFTDVFVRRNGRWQIVAGHASRIPPKKP